MVGEIARAVVLGLALGVVTGLPLGVVNVAVAATAATGARGAAIRIGFGGAIADGIHAACAFTGLAALVSYRPRLAALLALGAGLALLAAALVALRRREASPGAAPRTPTRPLWLGLALTLPNPAALGAWVAVAGALGLSSPALAIAAALGVAAGSAGYFAILASLAARTRRPAGTSRGGGWLTAAVLAAVGLLVVARAVWALVT